MGILLLLLLLAHPTLAPEGACPVENPTEFTDSYGIWAKNRRHKGIDIYAPKGTPAVAVSSGVVTYGKGRKGGLVAWLDTYDGNRYYYAHLDSQAGVKYVVEGTVLGTVGNTGNARGTSPHVHFSMANGKANPYPWLVEWCNVREPRTLRGFCSQAFSRGPESYSVIWFCLIPI